MSKQNRSKEDLLKAISKLKEGGDSFTFLTDIGVVGVGAVGAGAAAFAFGGATASVLFGLVAIPVAAPLAVVAGAAVLGGGALLGVKRALFDGTYTEGKKAELIRQMEDELREMKAKERKDRIGKEDKTKFHLFLEEPIQFDLITPEDARKLMELVETGKLEISEAYRMIIDMLAEMKALPSA
ncbi:hypothetical protein [Leptolyngbya sp. BC1307]|uniref:hypothetical protein n=1 Tax=Leptolyngbya sp. BC1307 TaxID=2029589 RepID=UPI000EFD98DF|nr:hypothetical protein [Leptolyngbya sp. BC1307]